MEQQQLKKIEHTYLNIRGLKLHIAHIGKGELGTVVFLHGFPEIWYSWRYQMIAVADAGFKAIAPDFRGYGLSEQPSEPEESCWEDLLADLLAILDSLSIPKAFIIAKDFGARPAFLFAIQYPSRVSGVVTLGVPFSPKTINPDDLPKGFYISRWREPGRAEADFSRFDTKTVLHNIYILFSASEIKLAEEGEEIMDIIDPSTPLPHWFTEGDLQAYAALYQKSGFSFPLQIPYRSWHKMQEIVDPRVEVPAMLIMGEKDYILKFSGMENYVRSGMVKHYVPDLEITFIPEGTHFVQEQFPDKVNPLIIRFLTSHSTAVSLEG